MIHSAATLVGLLRWRPSERFVQRANARRGAGARARRLGGSPSLLLALAPTVARRGDPSLRARTPVLELFTSPGDPPICWSNAWIQQGIRFIMPCREAPIRFAKSSVGGLAPRIPSFRPLRGGEVAQRAETEFSWGPAALKPTHHDEDSWEDGLPKPRHRINGRGGRLHTRGARRIGRAAIGLEPR